MQLGKESKMLLNTENIEYRNLQIQSSPMVYQYETPYKNCVVATAGDPDKCIICSDGYYAEKQSLSCVGNTLLTYLLHLSY